MEPTASVIAATAAATFRAFLAPIAPHARIAIVCHNDADGLAAGTILTRTLRNAGYDSHAVVTGKGENAWSASVLARAGAHDPAALIVADLGSRAEPLLHVPTLLIDHHRPEGIPPGATLLTGYGEDPTPTAGLLAWWCAAAIADVADLGWIAAISVLSDLGDQAPFAVLSDARARYKATPLRDATTLLNAARRSASGDAQPALVALLEATGPRDITRGTSEAVEALQAAKRDVNAAFAEAKKAAPRFSGNVAIVRINTPCQVHPLIAQIWRTRLPAYLVMCANVGYLPDRVNFSARSGKQFNILDFLRDNAPPDPGPWYGHGHDQASGGALSYDSWNVFVAQLGFGPELQVHASSRTTHS